MLRFLEYLKQKQKGQGIVEYALLLAFVVGIAMMLNGADLGGAVKDTFDKVAEALSGEKKDYAWARENLSGLSKDAIRDKFEDKDRIKMDQEALANIGKAFIGLTKDQVDKILKNHDSDIAKEGKGLWLTNYHDPNANTLETFTTDFDYQTNSSQFEGKFSDITPFLNGTAIDLEQGLTTGAQGKVESNNSRYFFSDYMMGDNADGTDRSIRLNLHYTEQTIDGQTVQVVDGARVRINVGSTTGDKNLKSYSADHDITVNKDKKYQKTIQDQTGLITVNDSWKYNSGTNAWYNNLNF